VPPRRNGRTHARTHAGWRISRGAVRGARLACSWLVADCRVWAAARARAYDGPFVTACCSAVGVTRTRIRRTRNKAKPREAVASRGFGAGSDNARTQSQPECWALVFVAPTACRRRPRRPIATDRRAASDPVRARPGVSSSAVRAAGACYVSPSSSPWSAAARRFPRGG
jgi:hypothetical protein